MFFSTSLLVALVVRPEAQSTNLDVWFQKDKNQQSCASCHSVDGIELRSFSDADILRRSVRHHSQEVSLRVQALVASHKKVDGEVGTQVRPMQPGGRVLPGHTLQERDTSFLKNLKSSHPGLFSPVRNLTDALKFQQTILDIDLARLPVGIEMNQLSEDGFHGEGHKSIADWIPDVPTFDSDALRAEWESYLANPTDEALTKLDAKLLAIAKPADPFGDLALAKYRSLLVYQHELRCNHPTSAMPTKNPFWQVAEFARLYADADSVSVKVPADISTAKNLSTTFKSQMKQLRVPWFWLGWIRDPSLTKTSGARETVRGDYFCHYLEEDGPYIGHEAFMMSRKLSEQTRNPFIPNYPFEINYSFFLANTPLIDREPKDAAAKQLFRQFTANSFQAMLYLLERDLAKTGRGIHKIPQESQIGFMRQYLQDINQPDQGLMTRVLKLLKTAKGT